MSVSIISEMEIDDLAENHDPFFKIEKIQEENYIYTMYSGTMINGSQISLKIFNKQHPDVFSREIAVMKKLNQRDCILQMIDFTNGTHLVDPMIVYEHGSQRTIRELIGENQSTITTAMVGVIEAVDFVHSHDMIIRNLKPGNIYLVGSADNWRVKIGGFTLAVQIDRLMLNYQDADAEDELLRQDNLFVAPEVFSEEFGRIDYQADVWSLGLIALFVFQGCLPWKEVCDLQENRIIGPQCEMKEIFDQKGLDGAVSTFLQESLQVSSRKRSSLRRLQQLLQQSFPSQGGSQIHQMQTRGSKYLQSLYSFEQNANALVAAKIFIFSLVEKDNYNVDQLYIISGNFSTSSDCTCQIVWNNRTRTKQIMKQIKVKSAQYDNEFSILRTLNNHPAISQLLDYVEGQYQRYMMLEGLDDGCLLDLINVPLSLSSQSQSQPLLKESCVQSIAKSLVSAVDYMHSKGIIHRGLNLSSILMKRVSEDEIKIKIWDFHTAIMKDSSYPYSYGPFLKSILHSQTLTACAHYPEDDEEGYYCVAPEILRNMVYPDKKEMYDEKADYWSVGMILFILAEGKSCFPLRDPALILQKMMHVSVSIDVVCSMRCALSSPLREVVQGLLEIDPQKRSTSVVTLLNTFSNSIQRMFPPLRSAGDVSAFLPFSVLSSPSSSKDFKVTPFSSPSKITPTAPRKIRSSVDIKDSGPISPVDFEKQDYDESDRIIR